MKCECCVTFISVIIIIIINSYYYLLLLIIVLLISVLVVEFQFIVLFSLLIQITSRLLWYTLD